MKGYLETRGLRKAKGMLQCGSRMAAAGRLTAAEFTLARIAVQ